MKSKTPIWDAIIVSVPIVLVSGLLCAFFMGASAPVPESYYSYKTRTSPSSPSIKNVAKPTYKRSVETKSYAQTVFETQFSPRFSKFLVKISKENGIDPLLTYSLMKQESKFKVMAKSPAGARGLLQLMPETAKADCGLSMDKIFEPWDNAECGIRIIKLAFVRTTQTPIKPKQLEYKIKLACAIYNFGIGNVELHHKKNGVLLPQNTETKKHYTNIYNTYIALKREESKYV